MEDGIELEKGIEEKERRSNEKNRVFYHVFIFLRGSWERELWNRKKGNKNIKSCESKEKREDAERCKKNVKNNMLKLTIGKHRL